MFRSAYQFDVEGGHDVITPHRHTFRIRIDCEGPTGTDGHDRGMVVDFALLAQIARATIRPALEGRMLTEAGVALGDAPSSLPRHPFPDRPTVEHMARWCHEVVVAELPPDQAQSVQGVVIWENEHCMAAYYRDPEPIGSERS